MPCSPSSFRSYLPGSPPEHIQLLPVEQTVHPMMNVKLIRKVIHVAHVHHLVLLYSSRACTITAQPIHMAERDAVHRCESLLVKIAPAAPNSLCPSTEFSLP